MSVAGLLVMMSVKIRVRTKNHHRQKAQDQRDDPIGKEQLISIRPDGEDISHFPLIDPDISKQEAKQQRQEINEQLSKQIILLIQKIRLVDHPHLRKRMIVFDPEQRDQKRQDDHHDGNAECFFPAEEITPCQSIHHAPLLLIKEPLTPKS